MTMCGPKESESSDWIQKVTQHTGRCGKQVSGKQVRHLHALMELLREKMEGRNKWGTECGLDHL